MPTTLLTDISDKILTITLNRPEKLNALTPTLLAELKAELDNAAENENISVVIIRSRGRAFCVGYDLNEENWITSQYLPSPRRLLIRRWRIACCFGSGNRK